MGRILAIDYGSKRVGIAVSDPDQIISTPLTTVHSSELITFLKDYFSSENVDCVVIGDPKNLNNLPAQSAEMINNFVVQLAKTFPHLTIDRFDERFTSKIAKQTILMAGKKKKARRDKSLVDKVSAAIILQSYLEKRQ